MVIDKESLQGIMSESLDFPQYFITAMLIGACTVIENIELGWYNWKSSIYQLTLISK